MSSFKSMKRFPLGARWPERVWHLTVRFSPSRPFYAPDESAEQAVPADRAKLRSG
jgi:hypothetical protein